MTCTQPLLAALLAGVLIGTLSACSSASDAEDADGAQAASLNRYDLARAECARYTLGALAIREGVTQTADRVAAAVASHYGNVGAAKQGCLRGLADNVEHRLTALELQERDSKAAYERGRQDCDGRTPAELVRNFDLPTSIASAGAAAAAYAERKDETRSTDAAFKGCLDALRAAAEQAKEASATDGAEESPAATSSAYGQPDAEGNVRAPPEFIGEEAEYYRNEWIVCASMTPEEIARDPDVQIDISGLSQDEAATMLAQVVVGEGGLYPQAQFEGCRDGVLWGGR